jgi:small subunit ribosomal protein S5
MVSNQGSKKGRGRGRGARSKDLNYGQRLGEGKLQVSWPGLNTNVVERERINKISVIGEDKERENRLAELRKQIGKMKRLRTPPHERGYTSASLAGKSIGPPISYDSVDFTKFDTRILEFNTMIQHKSKLGKKKTLSCFVVTGNGEGIFGFGYAKGSTSMGAIRRAKLKASKNLLYINLYENRTLFHNFYEEYYLTKLYAEKEPKGYGLVCCRAVKKICQLIGIKDIYVKIEGSRNPKNLTKALLTGLVNQV